MSTPKERLDRCERAVEGLHAALEAHAAQHGTAAFREALATVRETLFPDVVATPDDQPPSEAEPPAD